MFKTVIGVGVGVCLGGLAIAQTDPNISQLDGQSATSPTRQTPAEPASVNLISPPTAQDVSEPEPQAPISAAEEPLLRGAIDTEDGASANAQAHASQPLASATPTASTLPPISMNTPLFADTAPADDPFEADAILKAAAAYADFQFRTDALRTLDLSGPDKMQAAIEQYAPINAHTLGRGGLAYKAIVAARAPEFRASILDLEAFYGRDRVLTGLRNDWSYARQIDGAEEALDYALRAAKADARRLSGVANSVKQRSYDLQKQSWARAKLNDGVGRADKVADLSRVRPAPSGEAIELFAEPALPDHLRQAGAVGVRSVWDGIRTFLRAPLQVASLTSPSQTPMRAPLLKDTRQGSADRILTLAAFAILDGADDRPDDIERLLSDVNATDCLEKAQIQMSQCLTAVHFRYEQPFCLSEHAVADVGRCVSSLSR